jgi:hypothetical protein
VDPNTSSIGHLFVVLSNTVFDCNRTYNIAREHWGELEKRYPTTDYGNEPFLVEQYMSSHSLGQRHLEAHVLLNQKGLIVIVSS